MNGVLGKNAAQGAPGMSAAEPSSSAQTNGQHLCCLCSATLPSKEELQDHFRCDYNFCCTIYDVNLKYTLFL